MDVTFNDDEAVQQNGTQQHEHASAVCQHNVARDDRCAAKQRHTNLVRHKDDCPIHEEPAKHRKGPCSGVIEHSVLAS